MRRAGTDGRRLAILWFVAAASALALKPVWPELARLAPPCGLHTFTGVPCPTCGTTRAGLAFLEGHLLEAATWNPLAVAAGVAFVAGGLAAPIWLLLGAPRPKRSPVSLRVARIATVAALVANWIYLIARKV